MSQIQSPNTSPRPNSRQKRIRPIMIIVLILLLTIIVGGSFLIVNKAKTASAASTAAPVSGALAAKIASSPAPAKAQPTKTFSYREDKDEPMKSPPPTDWVTIKTFAATGSKKTSVFTVPNKWRLIWSCNTISHNKTEYNVIIHPSTTSNQLLDNSVEAKCKKSNTYSIVEFHKGGKVYLSVLSEGDWVILVQKKF